MALTLPTLFFVILNVLIASFSLDVLADEGGRRDGPGHREGPSGSWVPIKDPDSFHIKEIGRFAIREHNAKARNDLEFERVIKGEEQGFFEKTYKLIISARLRHLGTDRYEAIVKDKVLFKELLEFRRL